MLTASRHLDVPWNRNYMRPDDGDWAQDARYIASNGSIYTVDYSKLNSAKTV